MKNIGDSLPCIDIRKDYHAEVSAAENMTLPTTFSCPYVSPRKSDSWGVSWLFAGTTLLESFMLAQAKKQTQDDDEPCSEYHGIQAMYELDKQKFANNWGLNPNSYGYFGNRQYALAYLTRGDGAVPNLADPNTQSLTGRLRSVTDGKPQRYLVKDACFIPNPYDFPDPIHQLVLKNALSMNGVIAALMYYHSKYLKQNGSDWCYYCNEQQKEPSPELQELIYRSVVIVGWDDKFDKNKFKPPPKEDGAFKVRDFNTKLRNGAEYFWVSYEDVEFGRDAWYLKSIDGNFFKSVHTIYQHDLFGCGAVAPEAPSLTTSVSGKNLFKRINVQPLAKDVLEAVGFYVVAPCKCNFYLQQKGKAEIKLNDDEVRYTMPGYYSYVPPKKEPLTESEFSIRVEFKSIDGRSAVFVPLEKKDERCIHIELKPGESWIDSQDVTTLTGRPELGHVCIKAIVADESAVAVLLKDAYLKAGFPSGGSRGILSNLKFLDFGVVLDWRQIEPGSDGDTSKFYYEEIAPFNAWINDVDKERRLVVTLVLSQLGRKLKKLIWTKMSKCELWPLKTGTVEKGTVACDFEGELPVDGLKVKMKVWNKTSTAIKPAIGEPEKYPVVTNGKWICKNFWIVNPKEHNNTNKTYCAQGEYLNDKGEHRAWTEIKEVDVDKLYENSGGSAKFWTIAGFIAATGALGAGGYYLLQSSFACAGAAAADGAAAGAMGSGGGFGPRSTFDGQGNEITLGDGGELPDLPIEDGAEVRNLTIRRVVTGSAVIVAGAVFTSLAVGASIKNCKFHLIVKKDVPAGSKLAGIVGTNKGAIENCEVIIEGTQEIAGVAGVALVNEFGGDIRNCTVSGTFTGAQVGGVALSNKGSIVGCTVQKATIDASELAGGICAESVSGVVADNYFSGSVSGKVCGGITGRMEGGALWQLVASGAFKGSEACGGIAGEITGGSLEDSYSVGTLSGGGKTGGIAGSVAQNCSVRTCYSVASINPGASGEGIAGGIAGVSADGCVTKCVAANGYIAGREIYRTAKGKLGQDCVAMTEMQTAPGVSFPETEERFEPVQKLCSDEVFRALDWGFAGRWKIKEPFQLPMLMPLHMNSSIRHPFLVVLTQPVKGVYKFAYNSEVKFSGVKNSIIKNVEWELSDDNGIRMRKLSDATAGGPNWEESIGFLEKGSYRVTLYAVGNDFRVSMPLNVIVE